MVVEECLEGLEGLEGVMAYGDRLQYEKCTAIYSGVWRLKDGVNSCSGAMDVGDFVALMRQYTDQNFRHDFYSSHQAYL